MKYIQLNLNNQYLQISIIETVSKLYLFFQIVPIYQQMQQNSSPLMFTPSFHQNNFHPIPHHQQTPQQLQSRSDLYLSRENMSSNNEDDISNHQRLYNLRKQYQKLRSIPISDEYDQVNVSSQTQKSSSRFSIKNSKHSSNKNVIQNRNIFERLDLQGKWKKILIKGQQIKGNESQLREQLNNLKKKINKIEKGEKKELNHQNFEKDHLKHEIERLKTENQKKEKKIKENSRQIQQLKINIRKEKEQRKKLSQLFTLTKEKVNRVQLQNKKLQFQLQIKDKERKYEIQNINQAHQNKEKEIALKFSQEREKMRQQLAIKNKRYELLLAQLETGNSHSKESHQKTQFAPISPQHQKEVQIPQNLKKQFQNLHQIIQQQRQQLNKKQFQYSPQTVGKLKLLEDETIEQIRLRAKQEQNQQLIQKIARLQEIEIQYHQLMRQKLHVEQIKRQLRYQMDNERRTLQRRIDEAQFQLQKLKEIYQFQQQISRKKNQTEIQLVKNKHSQEIKCLNQKNYELMNTINKLKQVQNTPVVIEQVKGDEELIEAMKTLHQQQIKSLKQKHFQEQQKLISRINSLTQANELHLQEKRKFLNAEQQLHQIKSSKRNSMEITGAIDHLWKIKETQYHNINRILKR